MQSPGRVLLCAVVNLCMCLGNTYGQDVAIVSLSDQERIIQEKQYDCLLLIHEDLQVNGSGSSGYDCERTWDGILCWPPTVNGTTVSQQCPDYINGFLTGANATRRCMEGGQWYFNQALNKTWTNFTACYAPDKNKYKIPEIIAAHIDRLRLMYNIGYGISLCSLALAVLLMLYFKRLHCPRNMIHINLFASFILRCTISIVRENILVQSVGFPSDVKVHDDNTVEWLDNGSHWECKLFFTLFNYILGANYMWVFAEGLYLHLLITMPTFSEKSGIKRLIVFGWGAPIIFLVPWVAVRATLEDVLCWNTHPTHGYFWIIRGPICATMLINFFIFLNIIRVLFTKLNAFKTLDAKRYRYRKLAKSTLVLIPLFGVHLIVFMALPDDFDETTELVKLYYEMFFNSFQGFLVSLLFCFLNGEVQGEVKKKWHRFMLKRGGSNFHRRATRETMTSFVSRARGSIVSTCNCADKEFVNGTASLLQDNPHQTDDNHVVSNKHPLIGSNGHAHAPQEVESQPMAVFYVPRGHEDDNESQPITNNNTDIDGNFCKK